MKHILLAITLLIGLQSFGQKKEKINPALKYMYKEVTLETDDYNVYIIDDVPAAFNYDDLCRGRKNSIL